MSHPDRVGLRPPGWAHIPLSLAGLVVRRWVRHTRISAPGAALLLAGAALTCAGIAMAVGRSPLVDILGPVAVVAVVAICLVIVLGSALLAAVAGCVGADLTPEHRSLVRLPIRTRTLALCLAAPGMLAATAVVALAHPALAVLLVGLTGYGWAHAAGVLWGGTLAGVLAGRALVSVVRMSTARSPLLVPHLTTIVVGAWVAVAGASTWLVRDRVTGPSITEITGAAALTGWPALIAFALRPRPSAALALVAAVAVLAVVVVLAAGSRALVGVSARTTARAIVAWSPTAPMADVRLVLARLLRHRRIRSWILTNSIVLFALTVFLLRADPATRRDLSDNSLLIIAQLAALPAFLARGLDRHSRPLPLVVGWEPVRYTVAWQGASLAVAFALAVVPAVALSLRSGSSREIIACLALTLTATTVATVYSAVAVPQPGDSSAELLGGTVVLVAVVVGGLTISRLTGILDLYKVAAIQALLFAPLLLVPSIVETRRWRRSTESSPTSHEPHPPKESR